MTYNGIHWIQKCIDSLLLSSYPVKIIVIDNASSDQTVHIIKENYPTVLCVESPINLGFGQGNNVGLKLAVTEQADYVFLLNQDAWVKDDTIARLILAAEQNPAYGILSPIHLNASGQSFEKNFESYLSRSDVKNLLWKNLVLKQTDETIIRTSFVSAAAWLISASCLAKTGGFDPIFFHYGEDDHYAQRVQYHGFKMGILPNCYIHHDNETIDGVKKENMNKGIYKDWIFFLTHACNINRAHYRMLMIKRGTRHSLQYLFSLLCADKYKRKYNHTLARNIFSHMHKVKRSREICIKESSPYLG